MDITCKQLKRQTNINLAFKIKQSKNISYLDITRIGQLSICQYHYVHNTLQTNCNMSRWSISSLNIIEFEVS